MDLNQKENEYIHIRNIYKRYFLKFQRLAMQ